MSLVLQGHTYNCKIYIIDTYVHISYFIIKKYYSCICRSSIDQNFGLKVLIITSIFWGIARFYASYNTYLRRGMLVTLVYFQIVLQIYKIYSVLIMFIVFIKPHTIYNLDIHSNKRLILNYCKCCYVEIVFISEKNFLLFLSFGEKKKEILCVPQEEWWKD
jgi:hypothetical protein